MNFPRNMESTKERTIHSETCNRDNIVVGATNMVLVGDVKAGRKVRNNGKPSPFSRLGPITKSSSETLRQSLRERLGDIAQQQRGRNVYTDRPVERTHGTKRRIYIPERDKDTTKRNDAARRAENKKVVVMDADEIREKYIRMYPEVRRRTYDILVAKSKPPNQGDHIRLSIQMMKEREKCEDGTLQELLLTLAATHRKVCDHLEKGRQKR